MLPRFVAAANVLVIAHICLQWILQGHIITVFIISCLLFLDATPTQGKRPRESCRCYYLFSMHFAERRGNVKFNLIATTEGQKEHGSPKADDHTHTHTYTLAQHTCSYLSLCPHTHKCTHTCNIIVSHNYRCYYCPREYCPDLYCISNCLSVFVCGCSRGAHNKNPAVHTLTHTQWLLLLSRILAFVGLNITIHLGQL